MKYCKKYFNILLLNLIYVILLIVSGVIYTVSFLILCLDGISVILYTNALYKGISFTCKDSSKLPGKLQNRLK